MGAGAGAGAGAGEGAGPDFGFSQPQAEQPAASSPALQEGDAFGPTLQQASAAGAGKRARSRLTELKEEDDRSSDASAPAATLNGSVSRQSLADAGGEHSSAAPSEAGSARAPAWQHRDGSFAKVVQKGLQPRVDVLEPSTCNGAAPHAKPESEARTSAPPSIASDGDGVSEGRRSPFEQVAVAYRRAHPDGSESGSSRAPSHRSAASPPRAISSAAAASPELPPQRTRSTTLTEAALKEAAAAERLRGDGGSHAPDRPASGGSCSDSERSSIVLPADSLHQADLTWHRGASSRLSTSALSEASLSSWAVNVCSPPQNRPSVVPPDHCPAQQVQKCRAATAVALLGDCRRFMLCLGLRRTSKRSEIRSGR